MNNLQSLIKQLKGFSHTSALVARVRDDVYNINHVVIGKGLVNLIHSDQQQIQWMSIRKINNYIKIANAFENHNQDKVVITINDRQYQFKDIQLDEKTNQVVLFIEE